MTAIENLSRIELSILKRKRSYLDKRWSDKRVNANYSRIYYIKKGKGFIESFGKRYELKEGRLYLIPPRGDYSYGCHENLEIWWVHFTAILLAGISLFDYFSYRNEFKPNNLEAVEEKLSHLIESEGSSTICSTLRCNGILLELISSFLPAESCRVKSNYHQKVERFLPVLEHINRNLGNRVSIQKLSEIAGYERSHFSVLFKKLFGLSPAQYLNRQRVDAVLFSIQRGNSRLSELAGNYGFCDAYHLSKVVKRLTGKSPREHMREYGENAP